MKLKKERVEEFVIAVGALIVLILLFSLFRGLDKSEYNNAVKRCNGKENVVEQHTRQGDVYYICK